MRVIGNSVGGGQIWEVLREGRTFGRLEGGIGNCE